MPHSNRPAGSQYIPTLEGKGPSTTILQFGPSREVREGAGDGDIVLPLSDNQFRPSQSWKEENNQREVFNGGQSIWTVPGAGETPAL